MNKSVETLIKNARLVLTMNDASDELPNCDIRMVGGAIAEIGFKWGFSNSGRFAKLYAEKFGCKPSQTRRFGASPSR